MPITPKMSSERGRRRAQALGIDPDRVPPGQSPTVKWPVLSIEETPELGRAEWSLTIDGAVGRPLTLDWQALQAEDQTEWVGDIHCVTRWSRFDTRWVGVDVGRLLRRAEPLPQAGFVLAHSTTGYTTNLPLADLLEHPALVAHEADGAPLEPEHGGPVRLFVPHLYLWKSAKWLSRLQVLAEDELGFWETHGYHHRGDPWAQERHSVDAYVSGTMRRQSRPSSQSSMIRVKLSSERT